MARGTAEDPKHPESSRAVEGIGNIPTLNPASKDLKQTRWEEGKLKSRGRTGRMSVLMSHLQEEPHDHCTSVNIPCFPIILL